MNSVEPIANKAKSGIWGLDNILSGGFSRGHVFLRGGRAGHRQDHDRAAVPAARAPRPARSASTSRCRRPSANCATARRRTAGRSTTASRSSSWCRRKACSTPSSSRACSIPPTSNSAKPPSRSSKPSSARKPDRVVLDSLSEIRLLAQSSLRYRRQILALKHYFAQVRRDRAAARRPDRRCRRQDRAQRRARRDPARGAGARLRRRAAARCASSSIAARSFRGGYHDFTITTGGVQRVSAPGGAGTSRQFQRATRCRAASPSSTRCWAAASRRGSSTLILGPAGTGKSLVAITFVVAAIARGEKAALFVFDEELGLLFERTKGARHRSRGDARRRRSVHRAGRRRRTVARRIRRSGCASGVDEDRHQDRGDRQPQRLPGGDAGGELADPAHARAAAISEPPGRGDLPDRGAARPGRRHEGAGRRHLSRRHRDPAALLRGARPVRRAISVIKKRTGAHEDTIREYRIDSRGLTIGEPLDGFQGVLRGVPVYVGEGQPLAAGASVRETGRVVRACRHPRADGTRRRGGRGADPGSRLLRRCLRRSRRPDARGRGRRRPCRDRRRGDQDRGSARPDRAG